mmetsp:Transcript_31787/g.46750  ORF Transcript_31787/g.46750 Transcript_31787/m.46750 type:complete len:98 (-) Transcript_31787:6-299(-)
MRRTTKRKSMIAFLTLIASFFVWIHYVYAFFSSGYDFDFFCVVYPLCYYAHLYVFFWEILHHHQATSFLEAVAYNNGDLAAAMAAMSILTYRSPTIV